MGTPPVGGPKHPPRTPAAEDTKPKKAEPAYVTGEVVVTDKTFGTERERTIPTFEYRDLAAARAKIRSGNFIEAPALSKVRSKDLGRPVMVLIFAMEPAFTSAQSAKQLGLVAGGGKPVKAGHPAGMKTGYPMKPHHHHRPKLAKLGKQ